MKGASSKRSAASNIKKACLIPRFKSIIRKVILAQRFINRCLSIKPIKPEVFFVRTLKPKQELMVNVGLRTLDTGRMYDEKALLDCGATGQFMDKKFAKGNNIAMRELPIPIPVYNVDGTLNIGGSITHEATLSMTHKGHKENVTFEICDLGKVNLILGFTWLEKHNLEINWFTGEITFSRCPKECGMRAPRKAEGFKYQPSFEEESENAERLEEFRYITDALQTIRRMNIDKTPLDEESYDNDYVLELINRKVRSLQVKLEKKLSEMVP